MSASTCMYVCVCGIRVHLCVCSVCVCVVTLQEHTLSASTHHHCNDLNIYEGKRIKGKVEITIRRGEVVWRNDKLTVKPGTGRFLPLPLFGPLYDGIGERDQQSVKLSQKFRAQYSKSASVAKGPTAGKDEL